MTDDEVLDALCGLLPAQFETMLLRAQVPAGYVSAPVAPQATRATELVRWMRQTPAQAERVTCALAAVLGPAVPPSAPAATALPILFLAAEPTDAERIRLGRELEEIRDRLRVEIARGTLSLDSRWALRPRDLSRVLHEAKPRIVHFSGHGSPDHRLVLEADDGTMTGLDPGALEALFSHFPEVECVVLNACYSDDQAEALSRRVPHVVGMRKEITDQAAIAFSSGFYGALAAGRAFAEAFELGCVELRLLGIPEHLTPVLMTRGAPAGPQPSLAPRPPRRPARPRKRQAASKR